MTFTVFVVIPAGLIKFGLCFTIYHVLLYLCLLLREFTFGGNWKEKTVGNNIYFCLDRNNSFYNLVFNGSLLAVQ